MKLLLHSRESQKIMIFTREQENPRRLAILKNYGQFFFGHTVETSKLNDPPFNFKDTNFGIHEILHEFISNVESTD